MAMLLRIASWVSPVVLAICSLDGRQSDPRLALTGKEIAEAIEWGRTGRPEAYALRSRERVRVGAVYTPYLRVALASRAAAESNQAFTREDVTPRVIDPKGPEHTGKAVVYIAMRVDGIESPANPEEFPHVRLLHEALDDGYATRTAMGGATIGLGRRFGPRYLQYGLDPMAVYSMSAFQREQLRAGMGVELLDPGHRQRWKKSTPAIITASDLAAWK